MAFGGMKFVEKDKENLVKLLNKIAEKAKFGDMQVKDIIETFSLLAWAQKELVGKIEANILEVVAVHEPVVESADKSE
jgi:hypothetical protein